ncbi:MAG: hypothetical protein M3439_10630, partial [Chloroflexota bacterium]|nr:hypothetical protein [Chloroflexota bacterium]
MDVLDRWLVDGNGDGYPDDVAVRFVVDAGDGAERGFWAALLDFAARIGLETHAMPLPLVVSNVADVPDSVKSVVLRERGDIPAVSTDDFQPRSAVSPSSQPPSLCLTRLFTLDGALLDRDDDQLPDASRIAFDLPDTMPTVLGVALANLAARIGLESGGVAFPLVRDGGASFVVRPSDGMAILEAVECGWHAAGDADELATLIERVAAIWPHIEAPETGGASFALATLRRWLAGDGPEPNEPGAVIYERDWTALWEGDSLVSHVEERLSWMSSSSDPGLDDADDYQDSVIVFACEPPEQRQRIATAIRELVAASAFPAIDVTVLSSFKTGLSWLREVVIPAMVGMPLTRVRVAAPPHDGEDFDALDMRIRWLQELFPGNELIADATGLAPENIEFVESDDALATYVAEAYGANDVLLGRWECEVPGHYAPFISAIEDSGNVRVTTGGSTWY